MRWWWWLLNKNIAMSWISPERGATNRPGTQIECLETLSPRVQNVSEPPVD